MKTALAKTFLRTPVLGLRHSRSSDTSPPDAPSLANPVGKLSGIAISWVNGIDADSGIISTYVEISPNGAGTYTRVVVDYDFGRGTSYEFTGLSPGLPYDIRIANVNGGGLTSTYATQTATTLAADPALEPGRFDLLQTTVNSLEGGTLNVGVQRVGAGVSAPGVSVDWQISGMTEGAPSPANGTITWAAGDTSVQVITGFFGGITVTQHATLRLLNPRAVSGNITPTIGVSSAAVTVSAISETGLKWNPGFYAGTNNLTYSDDTKLSLQIAEDNTLENSPNVLGMNRLYLPACFTGSAANPNFSQIQRDLLRLLSISNSKRLWITIIPQLFNQTRYQALLPDYIYNDSTMGASPVAGKYGFWTMNGGRSLTIAWWRTNVMNAVINWFQKLAATAVSTSGFTYDTHPYVESTSFGELSMAVDASCPDYDTQACITQYERLIDAVNIAWPNTIHRCQNNFPGTQTQAQALTDYCSTHRTALGSPDIQPVLSSTNNGLSWGQRAALGTSQPLPQDTHFQNASLTGTVAMMSEIQGPELAAGGNNSAFTPYTLYKVANDTLRQSHICFTMLSIGASNPPVPAYPGIGKNTGTNPGNWNSVMQVVNGNTITNTSKPTSIP